MTDRYTPATAQRTISIGEATHGSTYPAPPPGRGLRRPRDARYGRAADTAAAPRRQYRHEGSRDHRFLLDHQGAHHRDGRDDLGFPGASDGPGDRRRHRWGLLLRRA